MKKKEKVLFDGNIFIILVRLLGRAFYYLGKGVYTALAFLIKRAANKVTAVQEEKERGESKKKAVYLPLTLVKKKKGDVQAFEQFLFDNKSTIGLILGARGTGKSAIGMLLLENFAAKTNKKIYALGFKQEALPVWIQVISSIDEIENNAVLLVDEGGIEFSSRNAMTHANKILSEILLIARHKDLSVMFITQNSSNLEVNAIRQADYLVLKPSSLLQKDFERKKIKEIYEGAAKEFEQYKDTAGITYIYSDKFSGFVCNLLPPFWSENVSKGYAKK